MDYRRTVIAQDESIAASATSTFDLPVNPLSHLIFTLRGLNVTDEATLAEILVRISAITVTRFGSAIFDMSATDLQKLNAIMFGNMPILLNQVADDNGTRAISLIVPFSRKPYSTIEGLPGTKKGELKLQVTASASEAAFDNLTLQIEAVEILGSNPTQHLKITTLSQTMTSGVDNDVDLPIGNKYAGLLVFSTTIPTTTAFTTTADKMRFLINNVERNLANANWESLHGELLFRLGHREAYDASADDDDVANYALIDFDPAQDDNFLVETAGVSSVVLKIAAGDGNAVRVFPIELTKAQT
ncbi:hypothetical protein LCGC14_1080890 [marine sediment metagenome]|uniref:Viral coat protein P2 N-terminal domain-containing protein n=1 Tax=marine sediment metagenome TaxID=412755 RepID=A0A0F9MFE5_9ZZZZ